MRIGIDASCWSNRRGYGRYARGLIKALLTISSEHEFKLIVDAQTWESGALPEGAECIVAPTSHAPTQAASANGNRSLRDLWRMSSAASRATLDAMFFPSVYTYYPILGGTATLLGVHDVIADDYPEVVFPKFGRRLAWQAKGLVARWQADYIVTVSEHAKAGIQRRFAWPKERVWVVSEAPDAVFRPSSDPKRARGVLARAGLDGEARFIAYLGGLSPHKNLGVLLEVFAELRNEAAFSDVHLVLVGPGENDPFAPDGAATLQTMVDELRLGQAVHFTGYLPDPDVATLLGAAQVLALPSLEEGFGLPAVEAAACGTPVVATRNSPLPNLLEGGGLFIDPSNSDELGDALKKVLSKSGLRRQLGNVAVRRARALTWESAAESFCGLLDRVAAERAQRA